MFNGIPKSVKLYFRDLSGVFFDSGLAAQPRLVLAFQQEKDFFNRATDIWFEMYREPCKGLTILHSSLTDPSTPGPAGPGVECFYGVDGVPACSPLRALPVGTVLQFVNWLLVLREFCHHNRAFISAMNKATGAARKSRWADWFSSPVTIVGRLLNQRFEELENVGRSFSISAVHKFAVHGDSRVSYIRPGTGLEINALCRPEKTEWRVYRGLHLLKHTDKSTGKCDFVYDLNIDGEQFCSGKAPSGEKPAESARVVGLSVDDRTAQAYRLSGQAVYEVVEIDDGIRGKTYLKVVNDNGEEIWIDKAKAVSFVTA